MTLFDWLSHHARPDCGPRRSSPTYRAGSWATLTRAWGRRQRVDNVVEEIDGILRENHLAERLREALARRDAKEAADHVDD